MTSRKCFKSPCLRLPTFACHDAVTLPFHLRALLLQPGGVDHIYIASVISHRVERAGFKAQEYLHTLHAHRPDRE